MGTAERAAAFSSALLGAAASGWREILGLPEPSYDAPSPPRPKLDWRGLVRRVLRVARSAWTRVRASPPGLMLTLLGRAAAAAGRGVAAAAAVVERLAAALREIEATA